MPKNSPTYRSIVLLFIILFRFYIVLALVDHIHGTIHVASNEINRNGTSILDELDIVLVKIGGSSITYKSEFERLDAKAVSWFASAVARSTSEYFLAPLADEVENKNECPSVVAATIRSFRNKIGFVIIHGAGSFGHFTAKEYGFKSQSTAPPQPLQSITTRDLAKKRRQQHGLAKTRLSVQNLNRLVVEELVEKGVNAVGISPCFGIPGLQAHANLQELEQNSLQLSVHDTLQAGLIPILHGDACLYGNDNVGILSGDTLMEILGVQPWVHSVVFITDVDGVFERDPRQDPHARLLRYIAVNQSNGEVVTQVDASGSSHDHDVTGGLQVRHEKKRQW
jgi:isopentenyl phosphate kinase